MDRRDIEDMVDARLAAAIGPLTTTVGELRSRIIGIDGNGTGREGELQRQNKKLQSLDDGQLHIIEQLRDIKKSTQTWDKATFYRNAKWWITIFFALFGSVVSYLAYRAHTGHEVTEVPHAQVQPSDAHMDMR